MKNLPWYIITALTGAVIVLSLKCCNEKDTSEIGYVRDSIQYWKNQSNQLIASIKQKDADFNVIEKGWKDSIAKLHNTTASKILEAITATTKSQHTNYPRTKPQIVYVDSGKANCPPEVKNMSHIFIDPYYFASVNLDAIGDSSSLYLVTYDTLHILTKKVKEGSLFNRRAYTQIDFRNANPNNLITSIKAYRIEPTKPKKFGIGPQIGITLDGTGNVKPYLGVGVQYSIIRL